VPCAVAFRSVIAAAMRICRFLICHLSNIEVLHTLLDQVPRDLGHLVGNDAEVLRWLMHRDQASAHVTNPFTSTQSDQGRAVLIAAGKFSSQKDELP